MEITIVTRPVMPVGVAFKKVGIDLMARQELIFQLNSLIQVWWFFMPDSHILNQIHIDLSTVDFRNRVSTVARSRCTIDFVILLNIFSNFRRWCSWSLWNLNCGLHGRFSPNSLRRSCFTKFLLRMGHRSMSVHSQKWSQDLCRPRKARRNFLRVQIKVSTWDTLLLGLLCLVISKL